MLPPDRPFAVSHPTQLYSRARPPTRQYSCQHSFIILRFFRAAYNIPPSNNSLAIQLSCSWCPVKKSLLIVVPFLALASLAVIVWIALTFNVDTQVSADSEVLAANLSTNTSGTGNGTDWPMVNYNYAMSRNSPQTIVGKDNVAKLQVKWIFNTVYPVENPPLIIGDTGYAQNNAMQVIAFNLTTGLCKWKYDPDILVNHTIPEATVSHGIAYDNGTIFAPTGPKGTIAALDASNGVMIWESPLLDSDRSFRIPAPPVVWDNYIIVGSALGDEPPFKPAAKGSVTALDRNTGAIIWQIPTTVGDWVEGANGDLNGGATVWTAGALDPETGVIYLPCGNPAPDYSDATRTMETPYANHMIAVNVSDGKVLWATPFIANGTILNVSVPDTHDWDTSWGSNLVSLASGNGTQKLVIGHNKRGDIVAMNATTGTPVWWTIVGCLYREDVLPSVNGSGEVWPNGAGGVQDFSTVDNDTLYVAVSNGAADFYLKPNDTEGYLKPYFDAMSNGIGNGSVIAIDLRTGQIKWEHKTDFPTWVSPLVTNGLVFSGHITATGKPYEYNTFAGPTDSPLIPSGIIMALDKDTGETLWEFNVGAPVGIGGPSIGQGLLLVTTGSPNEVPVNPGGYIVAFGLPS
jgi:alcohol dehydrogenase (cytochrome c)